MEEFTLSNLWARPERLIPGLLVLCLVAGIGCAKASSTETPVPFFSPTPFPTASATPLPPATTEPTLIPTRPPLGEAAPMGMAAVTREHLPSMVLTADQVQAEFPGLPLDSEDSGYEDNEAAAEDSLDPDDSGPDLAVRGRLDGYQAVFLDAAGLFGGSSTGDRPLAAEFSVDLFNNSGSAQSFIRRVVQDYRRLQGREIDEGVTLNEFAPFSASQVGTDTLAGRYSGTIEALDLEFFGTFILWRQDNLVLSIDIGATDDRDWAASAQRLALLMDQRLDGVLAGTVRAAPISPRIDTPSPPANTGASGQTGGFPGVALPAMLPTLADLASGAIIAGDGYLQDTDALRAYEREFAAEGIFFNMGLSQLASLTSTVELHATPSEASSPVLVLGAMDPQLFAQLAGPAFVEGAGLTPENLEVEAIDLLAIGDATAGIVMKTRATTFEFDFYMLWFARGRIAAQLIAMGPAGQVHLDDVARIARLMDQRIRENAPTPAPTPPATFGPTATPPRPASKIAFPSDRDGNFKIYASDADGLKQRAASPSTRLKI